MKSIIFTILCLLVLLSQTVAAQETKKVQEPEYLGIFAFLDSATGNLRELERQTPEQKFKVKTFGYRGGEGFLEIKGEQSSVRFKANQKLEFVVLVSSQQIDPMSNIQFFSFEQKKGMRRLMMAKVGSLGMSSKNVTNQSSISFNAAKYGASSFKIIPAYTLNPGEYCLSTASTAAAFCFGIDPAEQESRK